MKLRRILLMLAVYCCWDSLHSQECAGPLSIALQGSTSGQPVIVTTPNAGIDQDICAGLTASITGNIPTVGVGHWELITGPGTLTFGNTASNATSVTASAYGEYTVSWVIADGVCENEDYVVLRFYENSNPANAGPDQDVCELSTTTLQANNPAPFTGYWTQISGPSILQFSDITDPASSVFSSALGVYTIAWHVSYGPCVSADTMVIDFCTPALSLATQVISGNPYSDPGDIATFEYTLTNTGKFTLFGPFNIFDDVLGTIPVITASLAPGQSVTVTAPYTVVFQDFENGSVTTNAFATTIYNMVQYTSQTVQTTALANAADLVIGLGASTNAPDVGENLTFSSSLTNNGPFPATGVSVEVVVANGFGDITNISNGGVYTSSGGLIRLTASRGAASYRAGSVIWTNLTIPVGETLVLTFEAIVQPPGPGISYVNCAAVAGSDQYDPTSAPGDDDPGEDDVDEFTIIPPVADVACAIRQISPTDLPLPNMASSALMLTEIDPSEAKAGELIYWQLETINPGPDTAEQIQINATIPSSFENRQFTVDFGNTWYPWPANNILTLDDLPVTTGRLTVIARAKVPSAALPSSINVTLTSTSLQTYDPNLANNVAVLVTQIGQEADISVDLQQIRPTLRPGDTIEYMLTVTNHGPSDAQDVLLTDAINPALISNARFSVNGGAFAAQWTGSYQIGTLVQDAQAIIRIKGILVNSAPLPNVNPVSNAASVTTSTIEPNLANNAATIQSQLTVEADVRILVTAPPSLKAGENLEYTVNVTNLSNTFQAAGIVVTDLLQASVCDSREVSFDNKQSWQPWTNATQPFDLAPLQNKEFYIRAKTKSTLAAGNIANTFSAVASTPDAWMANNTANTNTSVSVAADLAIAKTLASPPDNLLPGRPIEYLLTFSNAGPSTATNVTIADIIPAAITGPVTYSYCGGAYQTWNGSFSVSNMAPGDGCTLVIRGTIAANFAGSQILNTATINGTSQDPISANNTSTHTAIMGSPAMTLDKTADKKVDVRLGETIVYTYKVVNTGNVALTNVQVNDVHNGLGALSAISPASVASLAAGATATFTATYVVTLADINRKTNIVNTATASATFGSTNLSKTDTESVDVEEFVTIGDAMWHDLNGDGQQNANEPGLAGVQVRLLKADGTFISAKNTDVAGKYQFSGISYGDFYVQIVPPAGYQTTFADMGNDATDSDIGSFNGANTTQVFSVPSGGTRTNIDGGLYKCAQIGDVVFLDVNRNDLWNANEPGINGIQVKLYKKNNNVWDLLRTQTTARKPGQAGHEGYFAFCEAPGQYYLQVVMPPRGLVRARPDIGNNEEIDSDITNGNGLGTTQAFTVISGQVKTDFGAGFYPMGAAGNLVWRDANLNGLQEVNEERVADVKVEAVLVSTGEVAATTFTGVSGEYKLDYLEKQDYYLRFYPPAGYVATLPGMGADSLNSDVDHSFGLNTTRPFSMQPDLTINSLDMGLVFNVLPVEWLDVNVVRENSTHIVTWITARESNVSHYEVERKLDGDQSFVKVGADVSAAGNSSNPKTYSLADKDVSKPATYIYRVKQVDFDGQYAYSKLVKVSHGGVVLADIYPNPAREDVNVDITLPNEATVGIELYDDQSRLVKVLRKPELTQDGTYLWRYSLDEISSGPYTIVIKIDDTIIQKKLLRLR